MLYTASCLLWCLGNMKNYGLKVSAHSHTKLPAGSPLIVQIQLLGPVQLEIKCCNIFRF